MQANRSFQFGADVAFNSVKRFVDKSTFRGFSPTAKVVLGKFFVTVGPKKFVVPVREAVEGQFVDAKFGFLFVTFGDDCSVVESCEFCDGADANFGIKFGKFGFGDAFYMPSFETSESFNVPFQD